MNANTNETNTQNDDCNLLAIRDLLQLTPQQEKEFFNELFNTPMDMPDVVNTNNEKEKSVENIEITSCKTIQNMPTSAVVPKMLFSNSKTAILLLILT